MILNPSKIDWGRWLNIANAYEKYGTYRAASRKTRFQSWDKVVASSLSEIYQAETTRSY